MKAVINLEDPVGKTVGRRTSPGDSLQYGLALQNSLNQLIGGIRVKRGVYRFHSHEDADAWMMNLLISRKAN